MNAITVPMFNLENDGSVKPNFIFHRPLDKVHSRCIEYPYAASKWKPHHKKILDVGTVKADFFWIKWLESLPGKVYTTDYDESHNDLLSKINFRQADIRSLPFEDNFFDLIFAVSVIEHIVLESPQTLSDIKPCVDVEGDVLAVRELARVLKGGVMVMTLPFGINEGLILGNEARNYTQESIKKFESVLPIDEIEYYEYQALHQLNDGVVEGTNLKLLKRKLFGKLQCLGGKFLKLAGDVPGFATWRRLPIEQACAKHEWHVEGVACGVWRKEG